MSPSFDEADVEAVGERADVGDADVTGKESAARVEDGNDFLG